MTHNKRGECWCILRTSGRNTLRLAETLSGDGFEVWTPARNVRLRRARWNVAREVRLPLMASFVFAKAHHLDDLIELEEKPASDFSLFRYFDRIPVVADHDLDPLRGEERAPATPAELQGILRPGERVSVSGGVFGGMGGVVERCDGNLTLVRFGSRMRVKISTLILEPSRQKRAA